MADEPREESWDRGLEEAFGASGKSVLDELGAHSRIFLREAPGDPSPLVRVPGHGEPGTPKDDSRYQILGEIGRGGIGVVYKAHDRDLGRDVALKVLRADLAANDEVFQRFLEEAQIGGQLQHPGLVPVYGLGLQVDGRPCFAMKLVKGQTLSALLRSRKDPSEDRRRFLTAFGQVCHTVAYAHSRGVVHRDLKPSNVMVGAFGEVQVVDWGFAKVLGLARERPQRPDVTRVATVRSEGASGSESEAGSVMGTPAYMPPEQALGHVDELDERSDVFALGAILCEILTGQPPYAGSGRDQLLAAAQSRLDEGWRRLDATGADPDLLALCRKCLSPLRRDRPRDAGEVAQAVEAHLHAVEERARRAEILAAEGKALETKERARADRERARAAWERRARQRTRALAAATLLAAAAGGWLYVDSDARAARREADASAAAFRALEEASRFRAAEDWTAARAAAENAGEFAKRAGAAERERAAEFLAAVEQEASRAAAAAALAVENAALIDRLTEIRLQLGDDFDAGRADAAYAEVFVSLGIEFASTDEAARLVRARGEVAVEVAAALDDRASLRRRHFTGREWRKLSEIARAADPDPWRDQLRERIERGAVDELRALAASKEAREQHPATLALIGSTLWELGDAEAAAAFLRDAALKHPDDFWILFRLGSVLPETRKSAEAARFCTAALAVRPKSIGAHNNLGVALLGWRDFDGAVVGFREAVRLQPGFAMGHANLGGALMRKGLLDEAEAACREAIRLEADLALGHANLGATLVAKGLCAEAEVACREAIRLKPDDALAHASLGSALVEQGRPDEALASCREAIRLDPELAGGHLGLGVSLRDKGLLDEAIAAYREAIRLDPREALSHSNLGEVLSEKGLVDEAVASYREAIRLQPDLAIAHGNLGMALAAKGLLDDAVAACREAIRLRPGGAKVHTNLGTLLAEEGRLDEAIAEHREAIRLDTGLAAAYVNLSGALLRNGQIDESIAASREAIRLEPLTPIAHVNLGSALIDKGLLDEAIAACRDAIKLGPGSALAHLSLGNALVRKGLLDEGIVSLREAIRLEPRDARALVMLVAALLQKGQTDEALTAYFGATRLDPDLGVERSDGARAHYWAACTLQENGRIDEAITAYREAIRLRPDLAPAHVNLGIVLRTKGLADEALECWRRALKAPDSLGAHRNARLHLADVLWERGLWDAAIAECRETVRIGPDDADALNALAWFLVTCPDAAHRKPEEAVAAARRAVALMPQVADFQETLGTALFRAGSDRDAASTLEKALEAGAGGDEHAVARVFLAMAKWRLGEKDEARALLKRAVGDDPELRRIRAEAEEMIGK